MALSKIDTTNMIEDVPQSKLDNNINFRNIIINGDMSIAQRGTSQASITSNGYYTCDRFQTLITTLGTWTQSQSTDVPTGQGFAKSLKMDCTTADASPAADDQLAIVQRVEGQNLQYLKYGTSSAESTTLSFWVKSNKTGTYVASLMIDDASPKLFYSTQYTISASDTWEKKTITYPGNTAQAFNNDNGSSLRVFFWLGAGSNRSGGSDYTAWTAEPGSAPYNLCPGQVNLADSTSNEWYITGVQLEAGTTASDFEFLPHDVNLKRCQRYYFVQCDGSVSASQDIGIGTYYTSSDLRASFSFPTTMRATPTLEVETVTNGYDFRRNGGVDRVDDFTLNNASLSSAGLINNSDASGTAGQSGHLFSDDASCFLAVSAEL